MPVQAIVTAAQIAARKPHSPIRPPVSPKNTQPMPKIAAGTKVNTDMTPSRDSQEERHCEKARQARSGRPRWNTEETRPAAARMKAGASATKPNQPLCGNRPSGAARPSRNSSANPAPEAVVKKTIDSAGCISPPPHPGPLRPLGRRGSRGGNLAPSPPYRGEGEGNHPAALGRVGWGGVRSAGEGAVEAPTVPAPVRGRALGLVE